MATAVMVSWIDKKGFGFARRDDGAKGEVYVHKSALPVGLRGLNPGTRIEFDESETPRTRRPSAVNVRVIALNSAAGVSPACVGNAGAAVAADEPASPHP